MSSVFSLIRENENFVFCEGGGNCEISILDRLVKYRVKIKKLVNDGVMWLGFRGKNWVLGE